VSKRNAVKAYEGVMQVRVVSYGANAEDAAQNAGTLLDWASGSSGSRAINTETGHWPVSSWVGWHTVGRFKRSPEHDSDDYQ
jgi:hypothetical protein